MKNYKHCTDKQQSFEKIFVKWYFYLINRNLWTAMKNELSLSGVTSQVIEPRLSMGVNVLCFELAVILEFSAF